MKHPIRALLICVIAVLLAALLVVWYQHGAAGTRPVREDLKELGHDAKEGAKDAVDTTKEAVHDVTK